MYYVISDRLGFRISIYFSKRHKLGKEHEIPHLHERNMKFLTFILFSSVLMSQT